MYAATSEVSLLHEEKLRPLNYHLASQYRTAEGVSCARAQDGEGGMIKIDRAGYDPDWKLRWARAHSRFQSLPATATARETRAALGALYEAHDAQFATVAELAAFRFDALKRSAFRDGFMLAVRPLRPGATEEDITETWRSVEAQISAAKRARERPPLGRPDGLEAFGSILPPGTVRHTVTLQTVTPSGRDQAWGVVIERRSRCAHVCLVQVEPGRGVEVGFEVLATLAYRQLLMAPRWRPWAGCSPRRVRFYGYVPWGMHEAGGEIFAARALRWLNGRYIEDWNGRHTFGCVPPALAEFDPAASAPHLLMPCATLAVPVD